MFGLFVVVCFLFVFMCVVLVCVCLFVLFYLFIYLNDNLALKTFVLTVISASET